jgi:hypothetical protein
VQLCCAMMVTFWSWLTAYWFCMMDYVPEIASI